MPEGIQTGVSQYDLSLPMPTEWTEVGESEKIFIYPLKSGKGQFVGCAEVVSFVSTSHSKRKC